MKVSDLSTFGGGDPSQSGEATVRGGSVGGGRRGVSVVDVTGDGSGIDTPAQFPFKAAASFDTAVSSDSFFWSCSKCDPL